MNLTWAHSDDDGGSSWQECASVILLVMHGVLQSQAISVERSEILQGGSLTPMVLCTTDTMS